MKSLFLAICAFLVFGLTSFSAMGQNTESDSGICSSICENSSGVDMVTCNDYCQGCASANQNELQNAKTLDEKKAILNNCLAENMAD